MVLAKVFLLCFQGITSAFCIRIPISVFIAGLQHSMLVYMGMAVPRGSGTIFFAVCFASEEKKTGKIAL